MTEPKYQIGDRIPESPFFVRGVMTPSDGKHRYFLQIANTDGSFVGTEEDIDNAISLVRNFVEKEYSKPIHNSRHSYLRKNRRYD